MASFEVTQHEGAGATITGTFYTPPHTVPITRARESIERTQTVLGLLLLAITAVVCFWIGWECRGLGTPAVRHSSQENP